MNQDLFFDAMDYIDDDMLDAVNELRTQKKPGKGRTWLRWASMAACFCIIAGCVFVSSHFSDLGSKTESDGADNEAMLDGVSGDTGNSGVTIPRTEVSLNRNEAADMLAFFIYEGRTYVQYEWIEDHPELVGEYVGTSIGMIDEWTPKDGYLDFAGSISGDFYTVNGFDPNFMLCMKYDDGSVGIYANDNGLTLFAGSDLFEDRLHLAENYTAVEYQTRDDWYYSLGNVRTLYNESENASVETVEKFITALNAGAFMYTEDVPLEKGQNNIYDREIYHLFFRMENGMTVHLRLYDGGYVRYTGLIPVCVKMDEAAFDALVDLLK